MKILPFETSHDFSIFGFTSPKQPHWHAATATAADTLATDSTPRSSDHDEKVADCDLYEGLGEQGCSGIRATLQVEEDAGSSSRAALVVDGCADKSGTPGIGWPVNLLDHDSSSQSASEKVSFDTIGSVDTADCGDGVEKLAGESENQLRLDPEERFKYCPPDGLRLYGETAQIDFIGPSFSFIFTTFKADMQRDSPSIYDSLDKINSFLQATPTNSEKARPFASFLSENATEIANSVRQIVTVAPKFLLPVVEEYLVFFADVVVPYLNERVTISDKFGRVLVEEAPGVSLYPLTRYPAFTLNWLANALVRLLILYQHKLMRVSRTRLVEFAIRNSIAETTSVISQSALDGGVEFALLFEEQLLMTTVQFLCKIRSVRLELLLLRYIREDSPVNVEVVRGVRAATEKLRRRRLSIIKNHASVPEELSRRLREVERALPDASPY